MVAPVEEVVDGVGAVAARDQRRRRAQLVQALGEIAARRAASPVSASASFRFGVTTVASGNSRPTSTSTASSSSSFAPELATMTGSTTSATRCSSRKAATVSISVRENSIPVFAASTPMSLQTASS